MPRQPPPSKRRAVKPEVPPPESAASVDAEEVTRARLDAARTANNVLSAEDNSILRFLEGRGTRVASVDPLSDEGLRLQAVYVQSFSQHPLDVMRRIMENPFSDPKDRMTAAKAIMEYSMRKPTQSLALDAKSVGLSVDASQLQNLTAKELAMLEKILSKATGVDRAA